MRLFDLPEFRFETIHYPFWRRQFPSWMGKLPQSILKRFFLADIDIHISQTSYDIGAYWVHSGIVNEDISMIASWIDAQYPSIEIVNLDTTPASYIGDPVRVIAQWEPMQQILMRFGTFYPELWEMHAQMIEAISLHTPVHVFVDAPIWAKAIHAYLDWRGKATLDNVVYLILPTNDIWMRDYGPIMAKDSDDNPVVVKATYAVLPQYPQHEDNSMVYRWASHRDYPVLDLKLNTEGGNLWADAVGTLLMSSQIFYSNHAYDRDTLLNYLHSVLDFKKLIVLPRLTLEETGHIDLSVKMGNDNTLFIAQASSFTTGEVLRKTKRQLERETNANGDHYNLIELPTPPLYINWLMHTVRRTYTNALTVNNHILVPIYNIPEDDIALRLYADALPDKTIIPIDSSRGINGLGAVHCMSKEIPV